MDVICNNTISGRLAAYVNDIPFRNHVSNGYVFEQDLIYGILKPYIENSKYIVDVGAHTGHHTVSYSKINPEAKIYSFEPQKAMFDLLEVNVNNLNKEQCKNVNIFNFGLGDKHCVKHFTENSFGGSAFLGEGGEQVNIITLDSMNLPGCNFIKIDVEGYEPFVLKGSMNTIKKYRPIICFEDNGSSKKNFNIDESSQDILKELEYVIHELVYENYIAFPLVFSKFKNISGIAP